eukprot:12701774-Prorocentrum_lima.AAC.1
MAHDEDRVMLWLVSPLSFWRIHQRCLQSFFQLLGDGGGDGGIPPELIVRDEWWHVRQRAG